MDRAHLNSYSAPSPASLRDSPSVATGNDGQRTNKGDKVVQQALHYKGTRYKFGGTSKHGVDCSGLVTRVWEDLKMKKIPRMSSALYNFPASRYIWPNCGRAIWCFLKIPTREEFPTSACIRATTNLFMPPATPKA